MCMDVCEWECRQIVPCFEYSRRLENYHIHAVCLPMPIYFVDKTVIDKIAIVVLFSM